MISIFSSAYLVWKMSCVLFIVADVASNRRRRWHFVTRWRRRRRFWCRFWCFSYSFRYSVASPTPAASKSTSTPTPPPCYKMSPPSWMESCMVPQWVRTHARGFGRVRKKIQNWIQNNRSDRFASNLWISGLSFCEFVVEVCGISRVDNVDVGGGVLQSCGACENSNVLCTKNIQYFHLNLIILVPVYKIYSIFGHQ